MATKQIQSVMRAFRILGAFDRQRATLTSAQIAERVGLNNKTVHRFLLTMEEIGAVSRIGRGRFCLGMALADLGSQVPVHRVLNEAVLHHLEILAENYNESIQAAVLEGTEIVSIAHIPSSHSLSIGIRVGKRWPAYCTAVGKTLMADMTDSVLKEYAGTLNYERRTPGTITSPTALIRHVKQVRRQGYSLNDQESELGLRAIAVPVRNRQDQTIAAISISGPVTRLSMASLLTARDDLDDCAERIAQNLYGNPSS
ncbi:MAG: IclR family transcriptional regulator [Halieaceae bacterium]|jgi:DNA-binding IclR family transcriptional regulator|nr:IclR family transcriptional regulator [Halieaceae bacterium]